MTPFSLNLCFVLREYDVRAYICTVWSGLYSLHLPTPATSFVSFGQATTHKGSVRGEFLAFFGSVLAPLCLFFGPPPFFFLFFSLFFLFFSFFFCARGPKKKSVALFGQRCQQKNVPIFAFDLFTRPQKQIQFPTRSPYGMRFVQVLVGSSTPWHFIGSQITRKITKKT